jgi:hypothetical protein
MLQKNAEEEKNVSNVLSIMGSAFPVEADDENKSLLKKHIEN